MTDNGFWTGRRVLVTGASGFLGAWLVKLLIESGADPVGFDLGTSSPCLRAHGVDGRLPMVAGSVTDLDAVMQTLGEYNVETCFHLAGQSKIEDSAAGPTQAFDVNVRGTWTVLEACRRTSSVVGVICASSNHTYGPQHAAPFDEGAPLNQLDTYGASKTCADVIVRTYANQYDVPAVAVRNTNTFGPADPHLSHIITGSITALLRDEAPVIRSDGSPIKAYLHAQDTMTAYMLLAEHAGEPNVRGQAFNVTAPEPISVLELVKVLVEASGKTHLEPVVKGLDLSQKDTYEHLSSEKIKSTLGWTPSISLGEGLSRTYRWYESHGDSWLRQ